MRKLLVVVLVFIATSELSGQTGAIQTNIAAPGSGSINAPNTAGSTLKDIYNVDMFTGTVGVNIPLYSYKIDGVDLGISLHYNTGGIKVDDIATNVGLGWSLSTGGIISREQVHGTEDELFLWEIDTTSTVGPTTNPLAVPQMSGSWIYDAGSSKEAAPDIFNAVIGGRSFRFSIEDGGNASNPRFKVHTYPHNNFHVEVLVNNYSIYVAGATPLPNANPGLSTTVDAENTTQILRFVIIDDHGNQFFFDRGDYQKRDYTYVGYHNAYVTSPHTYFVPDTWYLSRVITYSGQTVSYQYEDDDVWYPGYRDQRVLETNSTTGHAGNIEVVNNVVTLKQVVRRIKQINYPNGDVVTFETDGSVRNDILGNGRAISGVTVSKGYSGFPSNSYGYRFNYAYFNAAGAEISYPSYPGIDPEYNERLKLKSIDKKGFDGTTFQRYYTFTYIGDVSGEPKLPARLSVYKDCYGYYNNLTPMSVNVTGTGSEFPGLAGQLNNLNIPRHSFAFTSPGGHSVTIDYGNDLSSNYLYAQANLLNLITNGSGGKISFSYTIHALSNSPDFETATNTGYYDIDDVHQFTTSYHAPTDLDYPYENDGVKISSILIDDGARNEHTIKEEYLFTHGMRFFTGGYFWRTTKISSPVPTPTHYDGSDHNTPIQKEYHNSFVNPIEFVNGFNHGYSNVTVNTYANETGELLSKKAYTFTNLIAAADELVNGSGAANQSRLKVPYGLYKHDFHRVVFDRDYLGLLKKEQEYSPSGFLLSEETRSYNETKYTWPNLTQSVVPDYSQTTTYDVGFGQVLGYYGFPKSYVQLTNVTSTNYSGGSMTINKSYQYDGDNYLSVITYNDSKGISGGDSYWYTKIPVQLKEQITSGATIPFKCVWLTQKSKWVGPNIVSTTALNPSYYPDGEHHYDGLGNPGSMDLNGIVGGVPGVTFDKVSVMNEDHPTPTPNMLVAKEYQFDDHGNVIQAIYNPGQKYSSFIYDTRIGEKVAEVSNAAFSDIAYSSFEGNFLSGTDNNKGNWDFDPAGVVYDPGNAMTGNYYLNIDNLSSVNLNTLGPQTYFISLWYKGATVPQVNYHFATYSLTTALTVGDWHLGTIVLDGLGAPWHLSIKSTATTAIDELRLHPIDAAMNTYTYYPLKGVSSHCDQRNNITYYEYDVMGRQHIVRDINKNIVSLTDQVIQGADH